MKALALILLTASLSFAAIDGLVRNGTTGKPQPGATVTVFRVGQNGPESLQSVKSGADGKFAIDRDGSDVPGPRLLQTAYSGVTYNRMLPPGTPSQNLTLEVYDSSAKPGDAHVDQHMLLLEPTNGTLAISESYVWRNEGTTTYNDPDKGTLRVYIPPESKDLQVNVLAPQGMPIRRAADKTNTPNVYKIDFPIKPGESRVDLTYSMPFTTPGTFESRVFYKGGPTRIVAPTGVTLKGNGIESLGQEPRTQATIYGISGSDFRVQVEGAGSLRSSQEASGGDDSGDRPLMQVLPQLYRKADPTAGFLASVLAVKWILLMTFTILGVGFVLLYRAQTPEAEAAPVLKGKSERGRR